MGYQQQLYFNPQEYEYGQSTVNPFRALHGFRNKSYQQYYSSIEVPALPSFKQSYDSKYEPDVVERNLGTSSVAEPSAHYSGIVIYSQPPPPPIPNRSAEVDNTMLPVTFAPLYALIGVQPRSPSSVPLTSTNSHVNTRRRRPKRIRRVPVKSQVDTDTDTTSQGTTYYQKQLPSPPQEPYHVSESQTDPQPYQCFHQNLIPKHWHNRYFPTTINHSPGGFSAPVKVVIPNTPGDDQNPNGIPSLIPYILLPPQNCPVHEESFQHWQ